MGDSKSKKTFSKIGKFFGVPSGSPSQFEEEVGEDIGSSDRSDKNPKGRQDKQPLAENTYDRKTTKKNIQEVADGNTGDDIKTQEKQKTDSKSREKYSPPRETQGGNEEVFYESESDMGVNENYPAEKVSSATSRASSATKGGRGPHHMNGVHSKEMNQDQILANNIPLDGSILTRLENSKGSPDMTSLSKQASPVSSRPTASAPPSRTSSISHHTKSSSAVNSKSSSANPNSMSSSTRGKGPYDKEKNSSLQILSNLTMSSQKPRFNMYEDGSHEHNLKSAKRHEKLSNMIRDFLGAKKIRNEAKSAVPNILHHSKNTQQPPTLFAGWVNDMKNNPTPISLAGSPVFPGLEDSRSFAQKYGSCQEVIGKGSYGVVRISHKKIEGLNSSPSEERLYAVKEFRRKPNESEKRYSRRLTSEFCISSSLKNINIIETLDLLKDAKGEFCEVMEYCAGGDLYSLIIVAGKLEYAEADCYFKQLIRGVNYMHDMGVSHRDLKPENLLLTQNGVIKITDFGNGECFRMAWEHDIQYSEGICGSSPYIAPEVFTESSFDPRCVDIWACGVIYMAMRTGRQLWKLASVEDEFFQEYLFKRKQSSGYEPIESLKRARCRNVIYSILDPKPERRINGKQILNSEWGREIKLCEAASIHSPALQPKETESFEAQKSKELS